MHRLEEEQRGQDRAEYGAGLLRGLATRLMAEFGKGYDETNLRNFRQFFLIFPLSGSPDQKRDALRRELTWTHYRHLMRVDDPKARSWYLNEAVDQNWSTRALARQINTHYYERLVMSRDQAPLIQEMRERTAPLAPSPMDFIKDPLVLEFLGTEGGAGLNESDLERARYHGIFAPHARHRSLITPAGRHARSNVLAAAEEPKTPAERRLRISPKPVQHFTACRSRVSRHAVKSRSGMR